MEALRGVLRGRVLLICHHNADPDSICAAYAVQELVRRLDPSAVAEIVLSGGASALSKRIIGELGMATSELTPADDADAFVVLDTATLKQLDDWGEILASAEAPKVFIDHHSPHPEISSIASIYLADEASSSTCEVVHRLYEGYGLTPSASAARALLVGIAYDSRHFSIGTAGTFRSTSRLLEAGGPMTEVTALLTSKPVRSENIARLKAAQRMQLHTVSSWTIATTHVSSYQASAARALIGLGADVAVVAGKDGGELRASLRATDGFHGETSIHLGRDVAMALGAEFGGAGSGHSTAAGVNCGGSVRAVLLRAVELIANKLNRQSDQT